MVIDISDPLAVVTNMNKVHVVQSNTKACCEKKRTNTCKTNTCMHTYAVYLDGMNKWRC